MLQQLVVFATVLAGAWAGLDDAQSLAEGLGAGGGLVDSAAAFAVGFPRIDGALCFVLLPLAVAGSLRRSTPASGAPSSDTDRSRPARVLAPGSAYSVRHRPHRGPPAPAAAFAA